MQTVNFGPDTPNFNEVLTFNQFNVDLADVESIKVKLQLDISGGSLTVDNDGVDPATVEVELGASASLSSLDVTLLNDMFQPVAADVDLSSMATFNLAPNDGDDDQNFDNDGGPDNGTLNGGMQSGMSMGFVNAAFWADYIGAGTFDISVDVLQLLDFGGVGGVSGGFTPTQAAGNVMIIVTIPAPASAGVLGLGVLALGRRRR